MARRSGGDQHDRRPRIEAGAARRSAIDGGRLGPHGPLTVEEHGDRSFDRWRRTPGPVAAGAATGEEHSHYDQQREPAAFNWHSWSPPEGNLRMRRTTRNLRAATRSRRRAELRLQNTQPTV